MLNADDYVPLKWSGDLESVAKIRAVEAGIAYAFMDSGHNRLNDKNTFSISYNGISEVLRTLPTTIRQIWVRVSCSFIWKNSIG
ncbi:MAG: hypothetical protein ACLTS6_22145 [Anaerobutyricum sp.]